MADMNDNINEYEHKTWSYHMSGKRKPNLHRQRNSLPNLKIMPLTMAERRLY